MVIKGNALLFVLLRPAKRSSTTEMAVHMAATDYVFGGDKLYVAFYHKMSRGVFGDCVLIFCTSVITCFVNVHFIYVGLSVSLIQKKFVFFCCLRFCLLHPLMPSMFVLALSGYLPLKYYMD